MRRTRFLNPSTVTPVNPVAQRLRVVLPVSKKLAYGVGGVAAVANIVEAVELLCWGDTLSASRGSRPSTSPVTQRPEIRDAGKLWRKNPVNGNQLFSKPPLRYR